MAGEEDEGLRRLALHRLGPHAPELARLALERGTLEVERGVLAWEGSLGAVRAHRARLYLEPELCSSVRSMPSVVDALTAAVAAAIAGVAGNALAELVIEARSARGARTSPYRG